MSLEEETVLTVEQTRSRGGGSRGFPFRSHPRVYYTSKHTRVYLYEYTSEPGSHSLIDNNIVRTILSMLKVLPRLYYFAQILK